MLEIITDPLTLAVVGAFLLLAYLAGRLDDCCGKKCADGGAIMLDGATIIKAFMIAEGRGKSGPAPVTTPGRA